MQRLAVLGAFAAAILGCSSLGNLAPRSTTDAVIDDVTGGPPYAGGYCIAEVDGQAVHRAKGRIVTFIPVAILSPGKHTLTIKLSDDDPPETTTVSAVFEAGKRYHIRLDPDGAKVIEDEGGRAEPGAMP